MVHVEQISEDKWLVNLTDEDKKKIACIVAKLKARMEPLPPYGRWRTMSSEDVWEGILIQFCVMGSARPIGKLQENTDEYDEFLENLSIGKLCGIKSRRREYIAKQLKEYKATRFYWKRAKDVDDCLANKEIVKNGQVIFLEDLKKQVLDEEQMRCALLDKLPFFRMKSISDFMISIGAARGFIAFDTRVVGLLKEHFGLNVGLDDIRYDENLYKAIERSLRDACKEIGVELGLLDRMLFKFSEISAIEYILKFERV